MLIHLKKQKHWKVNLFHLLALLVRQELAVERKVKNEESNCKYYISHCNFLYGGGNTILLSILYFL